jgi:hypothetical protein
VIEDLLDLLEAADRSVDRYMRGRFATNENYSR